MSGKTGYQTAFINAGLVFLASQATNGSWGPAIAANAEMAGSVATKPNFPFPGPYSSFTAQNPTATLAQLVGSWGIDTTANTAWAVVNQPGNYAVAVQVFTEQQFTINVS